MEEFWRWAFGTAIACVVALIAYIWRSNDNKISAQNARIGYVESELNRHMIHLATNYPTNTILQEIKKDLMDSMHKMEGRLSNENDKLDKKLDRLLDQ